MARRRRRWIGLFGITVVVLAVGGYLWSQRNKARPVTLEEARERISDATTTTSTPGDVRPAAGVYEYTGSGTDKLSLPPLTQHQGPTMPGTVELLPDGCWRFRMDYSTNHWQSYTYCRTPRGIEERGARTLQRWVIGAATLDNTSKTVCDDGTMFLPTAREVDQEWDARCTITNDTISGETVSAGPYRFIGEQQLQVGGRKVDTLHFLRVREYSGGQEGSEHIDVWLEARTGLPIRNTRIVDVKTDTPVGRSHYTETGEYRLRSLTPTS